MILQETITMDTVLIALFLSGIAGLSTTIGAAFVFLARKPSARILALGLGFSGGVMLSVSFVELLPSSIDLIASEGLSETMAFFWGNFWFYIGIFTIFLLDYFIPHLYKEEGEKHGHSQELNLETSEIEIDKDKIRKIGILAAIGIAIHNFPEGLVTFTSTLQSIELGIVLTIAVALHNIPEGLSISLPVYMATGDRRQAFWLSFLSGMAEPVGALLAAIVLLPFLSPFVVGSSLGFVAGIMVFISFDELLPAAKNTDESHVISLGIIAGMILVVSTLLLLK